MDLKLEYQTASGLEVVWSGAYRGHKIATLRDSRTWLVVLDDVVQENRDFETAEEAAAWLRRSVDARIAEAIFPGLARV
jgi:hypothetical protein